MNHATADDSLGDSRAWLIVLVGLVIALFPMYVSYVLRYTGIVVGIEGPPSVILWNWLAVGLLFAFVVGIERRGLASVLLTRPSAQDVRWALGFGLVGIVVQMVASTVLDAPSTGVDTLLAFSIPVIVALIVTTAVTEEILFRGYVIERFSELTGHLWLAVGVSLLLFVTPHVLFFGPHWLLTNGPGVALLYLLYVWRRNLVACMLMHGIGNSLILISALGLA